LLHISPTAVLRFARDGLLPVVVLPGEIFRFRPDDLLDWIVTHRRPMVDLLTTR
jgi:predicted site-specific integrase-resolvase